MDAVALMMVKMGVSEGEMSEVMAELPDNCEEIPNGIIRKIMKKYGITERDVFKTVDTYKNNNIL